jgi:hypothetical protein
MEIKKFLLDFIKIFLNDAIKPGIINILALKCSTLTAWERTPLWASWSLMCSSSRGSRASGCPSRYPYFVASFCEAPNFHRCLSSTHLRPDAKLDE